MGSLDWAAAPPASPAPFPAPTLSLCCSSSPPILPVIKSVAAAAPAQFAFILITKHSLTAAPCPCPPARARGQLKFNMYTLQTLLYPFSCPAAPCWLCAVANFANSCNALVMPAQAQHLAGISIFICICISGGFFATWNSLRFALLLLLLLNFCSLSLSLARSVAAPFGGTLTCHTNARPMITLSRAQRESCRAKRPHIAASAGEGKGRRERAVNSLLPASRKL